MHGDDDALLSSNTNGALDAVNSSSTAALNEYLFSLLPLLLSASHTDIRRSFVDPANAALTARFANEQQIQSVYINKIRKRRQQQHQQQQSTPQPSTPLALDRREEEDRALDPATTSTSTSTSTSIRFVYTVTSTLSWHPDNSASLALIKRVPTIDPTRSIAEQIHVLNLFGPALTASDPSSVDKAVAVVDDEDGQATERAAAASASNPYGSLHSIVHLAVQPYFEAYISRKTAAADEEPGNANGELPSSNSNNSLSSKSGPLNAITASASSLANKKGKDSNDLSSNTGIPIAKKKFAELELSLLHLQQNVEIPETVLGVHPIVMRAVEQVRHRLPF